MVDSVESEINFWRNKLTTTKNFYFITKEYHSPHFLQYYFITLEGDQTKVAIYKQHSSKKYYDVTKAEYNKDLWINIDSLVNDFWNKPTIIPYTIAVSDGHHVIMRGKRNGLTHEVSCSNPDLQDPTFDTLTSWITQDLYWNAMLQYLKTYKENVDNSR